MINTKYQTITIDIVGAKAAEQNIDYTEKLDSSFSVCESIEFLEIKNSNNRDYEIRVAGEQGSYEEFAPRTHYLAQITNGASTQFLPIEFEKRARKYDIPSGTKLIIGVKHTEAMLAGEVIQIKAVCKLRK